MNPTVTLTPVWAFNPILIYSVVMDAFYDYWAKTPSLTIQVFCLVLYVMLILHFPHDLVDDLLLSLGVLALLKASTIGMIVFRTATRRLQS